MLKVLLAYLLSNFLSQELPARLCVNFWEMNKCLDMKAAFESQDVNGIQLECIQGESKLQCLRMIANNEADLTTVNDKEIYAAGHSHDLVPILAEANPDKPNVYYRYRSVFVVPKNSSISSLTDLRGRKSCHTGYGRTVGWNIPVSILVREGHVTDQTCHTDIVRSVASFFGGSCVAGALDERNYPPGTHYSKPMDICSQCENHVCSKNNKYAGYGGVVKCLVDGAGDIGFFKDSILDLVPDPQNFRLLCPNGNKAALTKVDHCTYASRPMNAIVARKKSNIKSYQLLFMMGQLAKGTRNNFNIFDSSKYQTKNQIFRDNIPQLLPVINSDYRSYMGEVYAKTYEDIYACSKNIRWCAISTKEMQKCEDVRVALMINRITNTFTCVLGANTDDCMLKVKNGEADLVTLDGINIYKGGSNHQLKPIITEAYDTEENEWLYWPIAVTQTWKEDINIHNLKGKTSCHTGIRKRAGWKIPVAFLNINSSDNAVAGIANYFKESCAPGADSLLYNPKQVYVDKLCALCDPKTCARDSINKYYSYTGALRCLLENDADVAFIKHSTVEDSRNLHWFVDFEVKDSDLTVLCPDGTRQLYSAWKAGNWKNCTLSRIPAHAVVTSNNKTRDEVDYYFKILHKAQISFGNTCKGCSTCKQTWNVDCNRCTYKCNLLNLFSQFEGTDDLLFSDKTTKLKLLPQDQQHYEKLLHPIFQKAVRLFEN